MRRSGYAHLPILPRIAASLGLTFEQLAREVGVDAKELRSLERASRGQAIAVNRDPLWAKVDAIVSLRLGLLLSIREELSRKLEEDRKKQMVERARMRDRL